MNWEINGEQVICLVNGTQYYCTNERGEEYSSSTRYVTTEDSWPGPASFLFAD
jgi:hypothetical protein